MACGIQEIQISLFMLIHMQIGLEAWMTEKSTSGGAFFMGSRLVSWFSKKQSSVTLSTAEAEYVALHLVALNCFG